MTSAVSIDTALNQQRQTNATLGKLADDFSQFLTLLTTQLQNQDPLNPMDTHEFTNQLVSFSQVEQQINSNKKLDSLVEMQLSNSFGMALGYVGMDINYLSAEFNFDGQSPVTINYALDEQAAEARIFIIGEDGKVAFSQEVEDGAGAHEFIWDGKSEGGKLLEPGTYDVRIDAINYKDEIVEATTVVSGRVRGVETQNGQLYMLVGERAVPLSHVLKATEAAAELIEETETPAEEETV